MSRVCFVGNSHLAAIKRGLGAGTKLEASFFGARGSQLDQLGTAGDCLVANNDQLASQLKALWGATSLRPDDFDALCVVGLSAGIRNLCGLYRSFRSDAHKGQGRRYRLLSPACFDAAVFGAARASTMAKVVALIRTVSTKPILLLSQPAPSIDALRDDGLRWLAQAARSGDDASLAAIANAALGSTPGISLYLAQPEETKASPVATKSGFALGASGLHDLTHMNGDYGAFVLRQVSAALPQLM